MLELYSNEISVCAQKVRVVLREKGVQWIHHEIDVTKKENLRPDYLRLNPNGVVPTLVHDGRVIVESTVISEYVDEEFDGKSLRPATPFERAVMRVWTKTVDETVHFSIGRITWSTAARELFKDKSRQELENAFSRIPNPTRRSVQANAIEHGIDHPTVKTAVAEIDTVIDRMEKTLIDSRWLAGAALSLADIGIAPYIHRLANLNMHELWAERPNVAAWYTRILALPSFRQSVIDSAPAAWNDLMAVQGAKAWETLSSYRATA